MVREHPNVAEVFFLHRLPSDIKGDVPRGWRKRLAPMRRVAEGVVLLLVPVRWRTPAAALARVRKLRLHRGLRKFRDEWASHHLRRAVRVLRQARRDEVKYFKCSN